MARLTTNPPLRSAKGDASTASRGMPEIHRSTLYVIPADAISLPFAQRRGRVRSTQGMPENHQHSPITASHNNASPGPFAPRHSRGRGNPEKNKARHFHPTPNIESSACFPICTPIQNKALYQPYMVLPNCTSHFYLTGTALLY